MGPRRRAHLEPTLIILDHSPGIWDLEFLTKVPGAHSQDLSLSSQRTVLQVCAILGLRGEQRSCFGVGGRCAWELRHEAKIHMSAHKDSCSRNEAGGKRRTNLAGGLPFELLPQAANVRSGPVPEESQGGSWRF